MGLVNPVKNSETEEIECPTNDNGAIYHLCGDKTSIKYSSCVKIGQKDPPKEPEPTPPAEDVSQPESNS